MDRSRPPGAPPRRTPTGKVIGLRTTYVGTEHEYLRGTKVRVVAVLRGAAADPEAEHDYLTDDEEIARVRGVTAADRIEVQPWIAEEGRFSFVTSDPKASDLVAFAHLVSGTGR